MLPTKKAQSKENSPTSGGNNLNKFFVNRDGLIKLLETLKTTAKSNGNPYLQNRVDQLVQDANVELTKGGKQGVSDKVKDNEDVITSLGESDLVDVLEGNVISETVNIDLFKKVKKDPNAGGIKLYGSDLNDLPAWIAEHKLVDDKGIVFGTQGFNVCSIFKGLWMRANSYKTYYRNVVGKVIVDEYIKAIQTTVERTADTSHCRVGYAEPQADSSNGASNGASNTSNQTNSQSTGINYFELIFDLLPKEESHTNLPLGDIRKFFVGLQTNPNIKDLPFIVNASPYISNGVQSIDYIYNTLQDNPAQPIYFNEFIMDSGHRSMYVSKIPNAGTADEIYKKMINAITQYVNVLNIISSNKGLRDKFPELATSFNSYSKLASNGWIYSVNNFYTSSQLGLK